MRKLPVDLSELETIFETLSDETSYYLDLQIGAILPVMTEVRRYLDEIHDDLYDLNVDPVPSVGSRMPSMAIRPSNKHSTASKPSACENGTSTDWPCTISSRPTTPTGTRPTDAL
jgi:hypothetical protein